MGAGGSLQGGADWGAGKGGAKTFLDFGCCTVDSETNHSHWQDRTALEP